MDKRLVPEPGVQERGKYQATVAKRCGNRQEIATMRKTLTILGVVGSWTANALTWFGVPGAVAVSAVLAFATIWYAKVSDFVMTPAVHAGGEIFLFSLWTIIGVMIISQRRNPLSVKRAIQIEYGICIEAVGPIYVAHGEHALQINITIRNYSGVPLKYKIELLSVDIGTRHVDNADFMLEAILGHGGGATIQSGTFPRADIQHFFGQRVEGKARLQIAYGPVQGEFGRRMNVKMAPVFDFSQVSANPPIFGFSAPVLSYDETDI